MNSKKLFETEPNWGRRVKCKNRSADSLLQLQPRKGVEMLILTRRIGEKLVVGGNVTVTVLGIRGNQIRIGIDAPPEVKVHREEIFKKINAERKPPVLRDTKTSVLKERTNPVSKTRKTLVLKQKKKLVGL